MTNNVIYVVFVLAIALTMATQSLGQSYKKHSLLIYSKSLEKAISFFEPEPLISVRAIRDFKQNYPDAEGVKWYKEDEGFVVKFDKIDVSGVVTYSRKGDWQYSIYYYGDKKLPSNLRTLIKRAYYDYAIAGIEEIHINEGVIFMVHIYDDISWKKIMIRNEEMIVVEEFGAE